MFRQEQKINVTLKKEAGWECAGSHGKQPARFFLHNFASKFLAGSVSDWRKIEGVFISKNGDNKESKLGCI